MSGAVILAHPRLGRPLAQVQLERAIARRGYHAVYRAGEANRCPGCGRSHWLVGRQLAECAFCATALPIVIASSGAEFRP